MLLCVWELLTPIFLLVVGQLPREGAEASVGRGRGGDLAGAGPEAEDAARVGGLAAGQRVKGEGTDKPQEQAQVGREGFPVCCKSTSRQPLLLRPF